MADSGFLDSFDRRKLDPRDKADFKSRMIDFLRQNRLAADALLAGNVEMLGMEAVKKEFGERWPKVRARVLLLAENVIKKTITSNDIYLLANDEQFIVMFGSSTREQATMKAKKIAKDINERLHGVGTAADLITAKSMVIEVPRENAEALTKPEAVAETVEEARDAEEAGEKAIVEKAIEEAKLAFWPVANVRKKLVSMYLAEIDRETVAEPIPADSESGAVEWATDLYVVGEAAAAVKAAADMNLRAFLLLPVHFSTLETKRFRETYLEACKDLPEESERRVFMLVRGMPDDVPQLKLHQTFTYVAPFVAGFVGQFSQGFDRSERLEGVKMIGVATDPGDSKEMTGALHEGMTTFVGKNAGKKVRTFFSAAPSHEIATGARKAKFDYVQGPGVAPGLKVFGKVFSVG